jgi:hypothetical protein
MSLFGAAWTLGSLKYLAEGGVYSATYYETTGWRGVMEREAGASLPAQFRSWPGTVFPLYHVFADVGEFAGGEVLPTRSSDPLKIVGLAVRQSDQMRVLLANFRQEPVRAHLTALGPVVRVRSLDETNAEEAMRSPEVFRAHAGAEERTAGGRLALDIRPFGLVRIDTTRADNGK